MYTLYSMQRSGNSYKVRLALSQLRIAHRLIELDILKGETRTPDFLAHESERARAGARGRARAAISPSPTPSSGMSATARGSCRTTGSAAPRRCNGCSSSSTASSPISAAARFWLTMVKGGRELQQPRRSKTGWRRATRRSASWRSTCSRYRFFVDDRYTIADIALYAYTHVAHESDFDLTTFPAIRAWLKRVAAEPGHITHGLPRRRRWRSRNSICHSGSREAAVRNPYSAALVAIERQGIWVPGSRLQRAPK